MNDNDDADGRVGAQDVNPPAGGGLDWIGARLTIRSLIKEVSAGRGDLAELFDTVRPELWCPIRQLLTDLLDVIGLPEVEAFAIGVADDRVAAIGLIALFTGRSQGELDFAWAQFDYRGIDAAVSDLGKPNITDEDALYALTNALMCTLHAVAARAAQANWHELHRFAIAADNALADIAP